MLAADDGGPHCKYFLSFPYFWTKHCFAIMEICVYLPFFSFSQTFLHNTHTPNVWFHLKYLADANWFTAKDTPEEH